MLVRETGATALIVSHDAAATAIADRIVHVRDGRIVEEARPGGPTALVVARGGWVRLPEPLLRRAGPPASRRRRARGPRLVAHTLSARHAAAAAAETAAPLSRCRLPGAAVAASSGGRRSASAGRATGRTVFAGLDATFRAGRFTAVVGRSGSGKTTLLHLLAGLERPTDGDVALLGE